MAIATNHPRGFVSGLIRAISPPWFFLGLGLSVGGLSRLLVRFLLVLSCSVVGTWKVPFLRK